MQSGLSFEALEVLSRSGRSGLITPLIEGAVRAILPTHSDTSTEPAPDVPPDADEQPTPVPTEDAASDESDDPLADSATGPIDPDALALLDGWLADLYTGKHRPEWMAQLVAPFSEMLDAESAAERSGMRPRWRFCRSETAIGR